MLKDFILVIGLIGLITSLLFGGIFGLANIINKYSCDKLQETAQMENKYDWMNGCLVKTEKGYVPLANYREVK